VCRHCGHGFSGRAGAFSRQTQSRHQRLGHDYRRPRRHVGSCRLGQFRRPYLLSPDALFLFPITPKHFPFLIFYFSFFIVLRLELGDGSNFSEAMTNEKWKMRNGKCNAPLLPFSLSPLLLIGLHWLFLVGSKIIASEPAKSSPAAP